MNFDMNTKIDPENIIFVGIVLACVISFGVFIHKIAQK